MAHHETHGPVGPARSDVVAAGPVIAPAQPVRRETGPPDRQVPRWAMVISFHRFVTGYEERKLRRRFYAGYVRKAPRWIPPPAAPRLSRIHNWVLDHSRASAPKAAGHCRAEPIARECLLGHAPSIRRTPMGCGKRPEHPDLGSHAAARPRLSTALRNSFLAAG